MSRRSNFVERVPKGTIRIVQVWPDVDVQLKVRWGKHTLKLLLARVEATGCVLAFYGRNH